MRPLSIGPYTSLLLFVLAAILEVGGDALVRTGLRREGVFLVAAGALVLATYGIVVNLLPIDFSRLLGVYVGVFALISVLFGRFVFAETVSRSTWLGLAVILLGSAIIHFGGRL